MTAPRTDDREQLPDGLLTITDLAQILDVDTRHVRQLVFEKRIPYPKLGDRILTLAAAGVLARLIRAHLAGSAHGQQSANERGGIGGAAEAHSEP